MLNYSQYPEGGNRDSPCESLDIYSIFTQLCSQENIITYSLPLVAGSSRNEKESGLRDQKSWSIAECAQIFAESCRNLKNQYEV